MVITAVIVLQWDYQKQDLILPGARTYGYNLYGWNTVETEGRKHLEAICSFLARRYTAPDMGVVNWVCGNEVNAWKDYHYCGNISFDQYMESRMIGKLQLAAMANASPTIKAMF